MNGTTSGDSQWQERLLPFVVRLMMTSVCFLMLASAVRGEPARRGRLKRRPRVRPLSRAAVQSARKANLHTAGAIPTLFFGRV